CDRFAVGVYSLIGAVNPDSFDILHSYSNTFQMPFVTPWFPEKVLTPSSGLLDFAISMRPDYHHAIIDTVRHYGWKKIIYLYDSHDVQEPPEKKFSSEAKSSSQQKPEYYHAHEPPIHPYPTRPFKA
ncbi:hypothetical protein TSAR_015217, partial [Trichomalopsis sarcophagae]